MITMKATVSPEVVELLSSDYYRPAVSITMPFEPKMDLKTRLEHSLKISADKIEDVLKQNYPEETGQLMMQKIRSIISSLNYDTLKKSISIYVSPVFEKVLYLDIPVDEKIVVDDSFDIRDLIYNKKQEKEYLVLLLSSNQSIIYLARSNRLERKVFDSHPSDFSYVEQEKEKVGNFTDNSSHKEALMEKFLMHTDSGLDEIIKLFQLPLFVFGSERIIGHFKDITKHGEHVVKYIHGSYIDASTDVISKVLQQHIDDWDKIKQVHILGQLEAAADKGRLVFGILPVERAAFNQNAKLLVIEKGFYYNTQNAGDTKSVNQTGKRNSYKKDIVDDIIEKVLEFGGDVEFVEKDAIKNYHHIALITFH